ncbi:putative octaprenyl pyrophosphate synthetase [Cardiobacterium valvarum F0432]|uniref:Putative octaprenyl pyrophosphate synthetase n=2 Tax=Cardiobacterium valvarum TaxID=194702 RepID=G9ZHQ7_9GAMM|nr:polyprenyl synthetase family protein [Cardiobacterium valvarum]EHM52453.1 putative octaprenyl pyrophosphate synthetase [Cardiobacterium valvarum F0432]
MGTQMDDTAIRQLIQREMAQTEALMQAEMRAEVPLAELVMQYAIGDGGKRFRPLLTLLSCGLCGYRDEHAITAAAFIEFIHNATLLHDDVVDESALRRGKPSANIAFGNAASVLVGDFLYTRAFQLMVRTGNSEVIAMMADAVNLIAAGEVMQLGNMHDPDVDESRYYRVIELKTAVLFAAACKVAGLLAGLDPAQSERLAVYGRKLGMAFQIMDDLLDYTGDEALIGKALGDDLAEGKPTLPLIRAQQQLPAADKARLRHIIEQGEREAIGEVMALLQATDALSYSRDAAARLADEAVQALASFPDNDYKTALTALAARTTERRR